MNEALCDEGVTYGSLCTGVGGLDLAVEAVFGARPAFHAELDKDASKVLARHWPRVPNLGDIRAVDWSAVEPVDIICSGPPCQPISQAGKRLGDQDDRWLWPDVLRVVGLLRPKWLVFENPTGISPWLPAILYRLAQMAYVGRAGRLSASEVGACHRRERVFIVAHALRSAECQHAREPLGEEEQGRRVQPFDGDGSTGLGDGLPTADADGARWGRPYGGRAERGEPDKPRPWPDGLDSPFVARMPDGTTRDYTPAMRRHAAVLGRPWPEPLHGRTLSGDFCEWMMMLPENWLSGVSNTAKKRLAGNAVVPLQAEVAIWSLTGPFRIEKRPKR